MNLGCRFDPDPQLWSGHVHKAINWYISLTLMFDLSLSSLPSTPSIKKKKRQWEKDPFVKLTTTKNSRKQWLWNGVSRKYEEDVSISENKKYTQLKIILKKALVLFLCFYFISCLLFYFLKAKLMCQSSYCPWRGWMGQGHPPTSIKQYLLSFYIF